MSSNQKKTKRTYDREYKRRIVEEYRAGRISANELGARESLEPGQIYRWNTQFKERDRDAAIEGIADQEGVSLDQARQIRDLQEELEATQKKVAQLLLENDLLKKIQPNSPFEKRSSGFIETRDLLARSRGRSK